MNTEVDRILAKLDKNISMKRNILFIVLVAGAVGIAAATISMLIDSEAETSLKVAMISMTISIASVSVDIIKNCQRFIIHKIENDVELDQLTSRIQADAEKKGFDIDDIIFFEHLSETYLKIYF